MEFWQYGKLNSQSHTYYKKKKKKYIFITFSEREITLVLN